MHCALLAKFQKFHQGRRTNRGRFITTELAQEMGGNFAEMNFTSTSITDEWKSLVAELKRATSGVTETRLKEKGIKIANFANVFGHDLYEQLREALLSHGQSVDFLEGRQEVSYITWRLKRQSLN